MIPNGYLMFEDENFIESSVAKLNALRKSGQFCDVRLQVTFFLSSIMVACVFSLCFVVLYIYIFLENPYLKKKETDTTLREAPYNTYDFFQVM